MKETTNYEENRRSNVRKNFETELRKNGFGFQYALLKEIENLYNAEQSAFLPQFAEFPAEVNNNNTHIDFILERKERCRFPRKHPFFLICECKRANPALSNWCFVRSPFAREGLLLDSLFIEKLYFAQQWNNEKSFVLKLDTMGKKVFDIAFDVKSNETGEGNTKGINDAVSQVSRGINGFIEYLNYKENNLKFQNEGSYTSYFLPVILTTAELWTSSIDLGESNIIDGNLNLPNDSLSNKSWIFFQYNQSDHTRHRGHIHYQSNEIFDAAQTEFTRTVAVVNPKGIADFLYKMSLQYLPE